jgi:hypothetical protein
MSVGNQSGGSGKVNLSGGTQNITNLSIAVPFNSEGHYTIWGGTLNVTDITGGDRGQFNYNGGTLNVSGTISGLSGFNIGQNAPELSTVSYTHDSGSLSAYWITIGPGFEATCTFNQAGGTVTATELHTGQQGSGTYSYNLSNGTLSAEKEHVCGGGYNNLSLFEQSGGTNTISDTLYIGECGSGKYKLSGGTLNVQNIVGGYDREGERISGGFLNIDGGTLNLSGDISSLGQLVLGYSSGSNGTYSHSSGSLTAGQIFIGWQGPGTFNQTGGTVTAETDFYVGGVEGITGAYNLSGGSLSAGKEEINLDGTGTFSHTGGTNSTTGELIVDGSYTFSSGTLNVGTNLTSQGTSGMFTYNGGTLNVTGNISVNDFRIAGAGGTTVSYSHSSGAFSPNTVRIGYEGTGTLTQSGGPGSPQTVYIGEKTGSSGTYNMNGGSLFSDNVYVGYSGTGTVAQTSGTVTVTNAITLGLNAGSTGTYDLGQGNLTAQDLVITNGTFSSSAGTINADITNGSSGTVNLSTQEGLPGLVVINGSILNNGTFNLVDQTVEYYGSFTNDGAYTSQNSSNVLQDLVVGTAGYMVGGSTDTFDIKGDFQIHSFENTQWDTAASSLSFITDGVTFSHTFWVPGDDMGPIREGYDNNFAWERLTIDANNSITLVDGNGNPGGALYVRDILGLDVSGGYVNNITGNGFNIYYDGNDPDNSYLGGQTYNLGGGGQLIPVDVTFILSASAIPPGNGSIDPDCSAGCQYDPGTMVMLNAQEDSGYPFLGWAGCDLEAGSTCTMTMDENKILFADFEHCMFPVKVTGQSTDYFSLLQDALAAAADGDTVEGQDYAFVEDITFNNTADIIFFGGYDCTYSSISGFTSIIGNMTVNNGSITIVSGILTIQ